jgi:hypothetical protein
MLLFAGDLTAAASLIDEVQAVTEATGSNPAPYGAVALAAMRGREAEASASSKPPSRIRPSEEKASG